MGLFDAWKKRRKNKKRAIIKTAKKEETFGEKLGEGVKASKKSAKTRREIEEDILKDL